MRSATCNMQREGEHFEYQKGGIRKMEQRMEHQRRQREEGVEEHSIDEPFALIPFILQRNFDV